MKKLEGKTAIVTGADSGMGQAVGIEFANEGADVVVCYHTDLQGANKTVNAIRGVSKNALLQQIDITDEQAVIALFAKAIDHFGKVDILVNSAGVVGAKKPVTELTAAEFDLTIKSDLYGSFYICRSFAQHRKSQGGKGKIINITSVHEEIAAKGMADYNAAKGALRNFTRTLALELAELQINVNNLAPGMIVTPMNSDILENMEERAKKGPMTPWKRAGYPEEIGKLALFLASPDSDYVTGASYVMDGGLMQQMGAEV
ncbi:SDR family NAD(P)-dependent oxidoreductase [Spirosoma pulveris]